MHRILSVLRRDISLTLLVLVSMFLTVGMVAYVAGRMVTFVQVRRHTVTSIVRNTDSVIPVIAIEGVRNGTLTGTMSGAVRFFLGDQFIIPSPDGTFAVAPDVLFLNRVDVFIPDGMRFVASRRGKKYYSVESAEGSAILPENRVYFRTTGEAEEAGFIE
ncbi:MAG: hypothetical protein V1926_04370 [Candidatus Peregrinibacteria bacterium]